MDTPTIEQIIRVPDAERDVTWRKKFFEQIVTTSIADEGDMQGPDMMPYIRIVLEDTAISNNFFTGSTVDTILIQGKGLALYTHAGDLIWVFTYGSVRSFRERGNFEVFEETSAPNSDVVTETSAQSQRRIITEEREVFIGQPSESFFPTYARTVVKEFLAAQRFTQPKIVLLTDPSMVPAQAILFSIYPDEFSSAAAFTIFMQRLSWFFPPPYGVCNMSRDATKEYSFELL